MAKEKPLSALERTIQTAMGEGRSVGQEDDPCREQYPALWEWLTTIYCGRDYIKQPASLTIALIPSGVSAKLVDRDLCTTVEISCKHLADVFATLNENLVSGNPAIKNWGKREPGLRKRKKQT